MLNRTMASLAWASGSRPLLAASHGPTRHANPSLSPAGVETIGGGPVKLVGLPASPLLLVATRDQLDLWWRASAACFASAATACSLVFTNHRKSITFFSNKNRKRLHCFRSVVSCRGATSSSASCNNMHEPCVVRPPRRFCCRVRRGTISVCNVAKQD